MPRRAGRTLDISLAPPATQVSWVGCITSVLNALGVKVDPATVAGMSGYAFIVNIHPELCPSGPTAFDPALLSEGTTALGIEIELVAVPHDRETSAMLAEQLFERVRQEIDEGKPCVVWGATDVPEYAIVYGWQEQDYLVRSCHSARVSTAPMQPTDPPEERIPFDRLNAPDSLVGIFFGTQVKIDRQRAERSSIVRALKLLKGEHSAYLPGYAHGAEGFRVWAEAIRAGRAEPAGQGYNLACYAELQGFAATFLQELSRRRAIAELETAARELAASAQNLEQIAALNATDQAARLLLDCQIRNIAAATALSRSLNVI